MCPPLDAKSLRHAAVGARPDERRRVLEEAAGIGGLHARRVEADAKLRAAAANLARAEDAHSGLEARLAGLRRQACQAEWHRDLSARIGAAEAGLLTLACARAAVRSAATAALVTAHAGVVRAASAIATTEAEAAMATALLPVLREIATAARTAAGRARLAQEYHQAAAARRRHACWTRWTRRSTTPTWTASAPCC